MSFKNRIIKPFSNNRADDNAQAMGRMWIGLLVAVVIISASVAVYTLFFNSSKDVRLKDRQRRQEQKDSIGYDIPGGFHNSIIL